MALDSNDEILQDFLVEAVEILELLNEQLVELEQNPNDSELLNAIFRGFHTIKGGAGFLNLGPLVNICHLSEDIFNYLRNGEKVLSSTMMDRFLQVLDVLNEQFDNIKQFIEPEDAPDELLAALGAINHPGNDEESESVAVGAPVSEEAVAVPAEGDITDQEFESLLDALDEKGADGGTNAAPVPSAASPESDVISEDEFDALLDELHGKGKFGAVEQSTEESAPSVASHSPAAASGSDEITEDEFDALLDEIHGKGKFSQADGNAVAAEPTAAPAPEPEPEVPKPVEPSKPASAPPPPPPPKKAPAKKAESSAPQAESTVRVDTSRLDDIMNMVGELVLVRNRLTVLSSSDESDGEDRSEEIQKAVANLDVVTGDLQNSVMKTRMQPIKKVFGRFPRVVRDLARTLKKDVVLEMSGEETDLDKNLVEALADPLVHLVRNSVDHGVEMPDVRESKGKPRRGTVKLAAAQEGDHILLTIDDDGAGMNADLLRNVAVNKGVMDEEAAARLSDKECFMLIFAPGFSTKEEISDISGRGVGMDVVKTRIASLNGTVDIDSVEGQGTKLSIKVPLTLAIMPTLVIKLMGQSFALPLVSVNEIFHLDLTATNVVDGQRVVMIREKALPLHYLSSWLTQEAGGQGLPEKGHVVVVHVGTQMVGFVVDHLVGQEEVVIKPLGALLQGTQGMAGATITGDGDIALILDIPGVLKTYS